MRSSRFVLLLALFTASLASAQSSEDVPTPSAQEAMSPPPLVTPQPEPQEPSLEPAAPQGESIPYHYQPASELPPDPLFTRIMVETLGGVLGGAVMGLGGLLTGSPALRDVKCTAGEVCILPLLFIMVPAACYGVPYGVESIGGLFQGQGDFFPTLTGSMLGAGAGFLSGYASGSTLGWVVSLVLWPVVGAVVGYEISHALTLGSAVTAGTAPSASAGPRVLPSVGVTPHGGVFGGLLGRF